MGRFRTTPIFPIPGFLQGASLIMDFAGAGATAARMYSSGEEAASHAMFLDWTSVGDDLANAMSEVTEGLEREQA